MLQPIEVMALDQDMNRASGGIAYRSLIWRRRYYECGTFELYVPKTIYKTSWKYIYTNDRPEMGIIETVCATDDVHAWGGVDTVKVSGRFAESLLSKKVLLPSRVTGYGSEGDNVAVSMKWAEEIHGDRFTYLEPDFTGVTRPMAPEPAPYGLILYDELKMAEASYRVLYDFTGDTWTVQPWRGLDRTQSQGGGIVPDPEPDVPDEPTIDDLYEPLDYIVATGEQWIDTGVYPNQDTRTVIDVELTPAANMFLFGSRTSTSSDYYAVATIGATVFRADYGTKQTKLTVASGAMRAVVDMNANVCSVGSLSVTSAAQTFDGEYPIWLCACNSAGSAAYPLKGRVYSAQIYQDGTTLTQDLVPKRRISDGAVGMLDLVSEVFYPSASGVAFLAPGELPAGYTRLEYIEGTGSQYIDMGVYPKYNSRLVLDMEYAGTSKGFLYGVRDTSSTSAAKQFVLYRSSSTALRSDYFGTTVSATVEGGTARATIDKNANITTAFGKTITNTAVSSGECANPLYLYTLNNAGSASSTIGAFKTYSCQYYDDGAILSRDCIPAKDSGGEAGLFDMVTMTFLTDASGTGFVAGPEVAVAEASTFSLMRSVAASEETTEAAVINSFALFSDQFGNIRDYVAIKDASNYKNTCVIAYEYDEPSAWESDGSPYAVPRYEWDSSGWISTLAGWSIPYETKRGYLTVRIEDGLPDDEAYFDQTSVKPPMDGDWSRGETKEKPTIPGLQSSYAAFPASLEAEGLKYLQANFPYVEEIDTGELSTGGYLRRWDLGDKVDALLLDIGIDMEARITGVDEVYEGATRSVMPIIGEKKHRRI